ncbi:MAG: hypothetical protein Q9175_001967 [Cornicularia normoerica]
MFIHLVDYHVFGILGDSICNEREKKGKAKGILATLKVAHVDKLEERQREIDSLRQDRKKTVILGLRAELVLRKRS